MSISDTIGAAAAANPVVGLAVAQQSISSAILSSLQSGSAEDDGTSALLAAISGQAQQTNQLLSSVLPNLGQNVNTTA
jgi:hypothetical protein